MFKLPLVLGATVYLAGMPATASAQVTAAAFSGPAYRINAGDELEISVWGEDRLKRSVRLLPDGTFAFPLIGQIYATGKLPSDIERAISVGLRSQYRGSVPQVTVSVKNPAGFQFSVIGKVRSPGTFTPGRYINALEALSMAGGPTEFAQVGAVRIVRKIASGLQSVPVRLAAVLRGSTGLISQADVPSVLSGDTLVVP